MDDEVRSRTVYHQLLKRKLRVMNGQGCNGGAVGTLLRLETSGKPRCQRQPGKAKWEGLVQWQCRFHSISARSFSFKTRGEPSVAARWIMLAPQLPSNK